MDLEDERSRRHAAFENSADAFSEDGVPVKNKKYAAYKKDGQGRVEIPRHMIMIRHSKLESAVLTDNLHFRKNNMNLNGDSTLLQGSECTTPGSNIGGKEYPIIRISLILNIV